MGFGTRIKSAIHGDKNSLGSKRRKAPGAYPESSVDIPRTNTTTSWKTANTNPNGPAREANKAESIAEEDKYDEYTHAPIDEKQAHRDVVSPIQKEPDEGLFSTVDDKTDEKPNKQHPYWGDVGGPKPKDFVAVDEKIMDNSDADSGIAAVGKHSVDPADSYEGLEVHHPKPMVGATYGTYVNGLTRNDSMSNTHPALRGATNAANGDTNDFNPPPKSVNRGRVMLVDDDAAKAASMVASQVSQTSQSTEYAPDDYNAARTYSNTGYSNGYGTVHGPGEMGYDATPTVQRSGTIGRGNVQDNHGPFGVTPPHHSDPYGPEQAPTQNLAKTGTGLSDPCYNRVEDPSHRDFAQTMGFQARGQTGYNVQPGGVVAGQTNQVEGSSPTHSSEQSNGANSAKPQGGDHYGPGHAGARVLHQCQHCGHDNDITKYFSRDVVYRLS